MNGKLKIKEISQQTGLSISTVSRVLAGKMNTSVQARQRVLESARQLGSLQSLSSGRLMLNNMLVFAPQRAFDVRSDIFYYKVLQGISAALAPHEVRLRYCGLEENDSDRRLFLQKMNDADTEAMLIIGIDDEVIHAMAADSQKPCVLINCSDRQMRLDSVSPDHQRIGEFAASFLIEQGHTQIVNLQCLRRPTMELRLNGIRQAWARHHMAFDEHQHLIATNGFSSEEAEQALAAYLDDLTPDQYPSAILAGGDYMAAGAMRALQKRQINVPGTISLLSTDAVNLAEIADVPLTSVQVPRDELGFEAVQLVQRRILQPDAPPCAMLLQGTLALRASVKRLTAARVTQPHGSRMHGVYDD